MENIKHNVCVPYTPHQMYELVNDIEAYPQFLSWCTEAKILSCSENEIRATLAVAKGPLRYRFSTQNQLEKNSRVGMTLIEGPFRHLKGFWKFESRGQHCQVQFELEYEFLNRWMSMTLGPVFQIMLNPMVDAFVQRAGTIYPKV